LEALKKAKVSYEKACKEAEITKLTYEKAKSDPQTKQKDLPKLEKEAATKQATAIAKDEAYKKQVEDTNSIMEQYFTDKMPKILNEFEHFETVRIQMVKANLKKYVRILQDLPPCLTKESDSLSQSIERINHDGDVDLFVSQNKTHQDVPEPFEYEPYQHGNQVAKTKPADKIKRFMRAKSTTKEKLEKEAAAGNNSPPGLPPATPVPKPKTAVFGVPLSEVMDKQKEGWATSEIPHILEALVDAVFAMDGTKTEGIFRIPASGPELNLVKDKIDHGSYDIVPNCIQVFTPCALIKLWLRELPDPLVPANLYEPATETPEKSLELLEQMPPLNKKVILYLIQFLHDLSQAEVIESTKMSLDNLAMCLAPSFLRCPYQDYNRVLASTDKQKAFVLDLMAKVPSPTKPLWRAKDAKDTEAAPNDPFTAATPPPLPPFPGEEEKKPDS